MDLTFLIADTDKDTAAYLREQVREMAEQKDFTYRLFAVKEPGAWQEIPCRDLTMVSLCMINRDYPQAVELGKQIYAANPFCRLIYYGPSDRDVKTCLPSRPVRYLTVEKEAPLLKACLWREYDAIFLQRRYFRYHDRYQVLSEPYTGILYFTSRDRMVYYETPFGERGPLRKTLDQVEAMLEPDCYFRCHKSFLVRADLCTAWDNTTKELVLPHGLRVPVSRAYRAMLDQLLSQNGDLADQNARLPDKAEVI